MAQRRTASDIWREVAGLSEECAHCEFIQLVNPKKLCPACEKGLDAA